jgi:hypothetical protein
VDVKDTLPVELEVIEAVGDAVRAVEGVRGALRVPEKDPTTEPLLTELLLGFPEAEE